MTRKKADDLAAIQRRASGKRWVWVERPTLLHRRATKAGQCPCGCQSWSGEDEDDRAALLVETIPGPEVLIDRWTGTRKLRSSQSELDGTLAAFDRFKALEEHVDHVVLPRRCYPEQLLGLNARPKVKGFFGGSRGGKTTLMAEEAVDAWIELGGRGVKLWWVAPELADCQRGVNKLVLGEAIRGGERAERRPPIFDPRLVDDFPGRDNPDGLLEQIKRRKPIRLVDGTIIELRYAGRGGAVDDQQGGGSRRGGNLKGDVCAWIGVDEGAEILSSSTWHTLIQRTTDSGGWLTTATTPVVGSPLKHLIFDEGTDITANDGEYLTGYIQVSMESNPWITPREVKRTIATLELEPNGKDLIDQDVRGLWIVPGGKMWEHFDPEVHIVEGPSRLVEDYRVDGRRLRAITEGVAIRFFRGTKSPLHRVGGQDFNHRGHFTVVVQIGCPEGLDETDSENWVVFAEDEVRKAGEPAEAARFLSRQAAAVRSLPKAHFARLAIACDSTGAQDRVSESATGNVRSMFTPCDEYIKAGFDMRPCHRSDKGKPINPEKLAQQGVLHKLMRRNDLGQQAPRYLAGDVEGLPPSTRLLVHKARCPELIKGLREQRRNQFGFLRKRSDTRDDRISDPVDAFLYILWALFADATFYPAAKVHW